MAVFTFTTEDVFYSSDYFLCKWGNDLIKLRGFKQSGKPIEEKLCRWLVSKFSFRSLVDHVFCYWKDCYFKKYYRLCFGFKTTIIHVEYWVTCASRRFYFCNTTLLFMYFFKKKKRKKHHGRQQILNWTEGFCLFPYWCEVSHESKLWGWGSLLQHYLQHGDRICSFY